MGVRSNRILGAVLNYRPVRNVRFALQGNQLETDYVATGPARQLAFTGALELSF